MLYPIAIDNTFAFPDPANHFTRQLVPKDAASGDEWPNGGSEQSWNGGSLTNSSSRLTEKWLENNDNDEVFFSFACDSGHHRGT